MFHKFVGHREVYENERKHYALLIIRCILIDRPFEACERVPTDQSIPLLTFSSYETMPFYQNKVRDINRKSYFRIIDNFLMYEREESVTFSF